MNNSSVIRRGARLARLLIRKHLVSSGRELALSALRGAVTAWDSTWKNQNLTGNTRTGFCSAVFYNGKLQEPVYNVFDMPAQPMHPTSPITKVGASGFRDYDSHEYIGSEDDPFVRKYKNKNWHFVSGGVGEYAFELTEQWIRNEYKPPKRGLVVVVANCSPYANFLHDVRTMDILDSESDANAIMQKLESAFASKPLDEF